MEVKNWWESKTVWINIITFLVAMLVLVTGPDFPVQLPAEIAKYLLGGVALLNLAIRFVTTEPIR
jgi:hypothetical protein